MIAAAAAAALAAAGLGLQVLKAARRGRRPFFAPASGDASKGMLYAFGPGMMPWAKESAAEHLPTYFAGVVFHAGAFAAMAWLCLQASGAAVPRALVLGFTGMLTIGLVSGAGLLVKRLTAKELRAISLPDDFISNLLTDLFIAAALAATLSSIAASLPFAAAIPLFLYIPLGKIRHCCFFFYSRALLGLWLGRRGVFPPKAEGL